jgi:probable lipoprotein
MKNVKRLMLGIVAIFAVVLLVACGAKSDNGTYKMETNINQLMGQDSESEVSKDAKVTIELTIKDSKGELNIIQKIAGKEVPIKLDLKVDQKKKSLKRSYGDMELKYNIKGDELTFDLSKLSSSDQANLLFLKNAKLKRSK